MIFPIPKEHRFPHPRYAEPDGLLGVGGDLDPDRVLVAYRMGIFPWYSEGQPICWWSPDPRYVLRTADLVVQRSLAKRIRQRPYRITLDRAFEEVITRCAATARPGQSGTWITRAMRRAYVELHALGHAHSVEAWEEDRLVGGLYGLAVGKLMSGESMFADRPDASKIAFVHLARQLHRWEYPLVDCQVHTAHLERFGAGPIPRQDYLREVVDLTARPGHVGPWTFDADLVVNG